MVRKYKAWIAGVVALLAVVVGLAFALRPKPQPVADGTGKLHGKRNLMIMGVDKRSGDAGRSDTLMVAWWTRARTNSLCFQCPGIPWYPFPAMAGIRSTMPMPMGVTS